jgi:small GTP-binding protein
MPLPPITVDALGNPVIKLIVIGDSGTGKSSLIQRFIADDFASGGQTQTIGVEFASKALPWKDGFVVKVQIWDTAGQERYRSITRSYYRGAHACLIVYDVTREESFQHVTQWRSDALELACSDGPLLLLGNKIDLVGGDDAAKGPDGLLAIRREVPKARAQQFAQQNHMAHFEVSAATGEGVEAAFVQAMKRVMVASENFTEHNEPLQHENCSDGLLPEEPVATRRRIRSNCCAQ